MVLSTYVGVRLDTRYIAKKEDKSLKQWRESLPISAFTKEDAEWMEHALSLAGIKQEVVVTCSCGYANDCAMHCNHGVHPDCTGPSYFTLNNIEKTLKQQIDSSQSTAGIVRKPPAGRGSASQWGGKFIATQTPDLATNELRALYQSIKKAEYEAIIMNEQPENSFRYLLEKPTYETIYR